MASVSENISTELLNMTGFQRGQLSIKHPGVPIKLTKLTRHDSKHLLIGYAPKSKDGLQRGLHMQVE